MAEATTEYIAPAETAIWKRVSWPAVFGGTFVALATEVLFTAFGLFIGFTLSSPGGVATWSKIWYFVTAFVALFLGGWVAAQLSTNTSAGGRLHGAITWGLTTMATFAVIVWLFWGAVSASILAIRTAAVTTGAAAVNQAAQQAPHMAGTVVGDASTLFLVIFGGVLCGCVASLLGGSLGGTGRLPTRFIKSAGLSSSPSTRAASA